MARTALSEIEERISAALRAAGRTDEATLVVVTKYASDEAVEAVLADGATHLGESRAQSLVERVEAFPGANWHFVGRLQTNKAGRVRSRVALLQSMDRSRLASAWESPEAPPVLVQVDLVGEPQKGGVSVSEAPALVEECRRLDIEVHGLMTVPPRPGQAADSARWFAALRELRDRIALDHPGVTELSMGMSMDYEVAVAEGATILRVGRAIFPPFDNGG